MENTDPRIDAYIAKAGDFAKPVLTHLRELVHQAWPDVVETIKWGFPFFDYKGTLCNMAAFKEHASFGFWKAAMLKDEHKVIAKGDDAAAGSLGKIYTLADLP